MTVSSPPGQVRVIARHTLRCADPASTARLRDPFALGPLDSLVLPFFVIRVVFLYRHVPDDVAGELIPEGHLRRALARLLDYYPQLTGRLRLGSGANGDPEITSLGKGGQFLVAECGEALDEMVGPGKRLVVTDLPGMGSDLVARWDDPVDGICRSPILSIQHTRFACGGVALGFTAHHMACDGSGFFQMVRDLAEIYRSLGKPGSPGSGVPSRPMLARPPHIFSHLAGADALTLDERRAALNYQPEILCLKQEQDGPHKEGEGADTFEAFNGQDAPPLDGRVLRFSASAMAVLKEHATGPGGAGWVSSFEALSALLYQRIYMARQKLLGARGVSAEEARSVFSRSFVASMDIRGPDRLDLPARYFANAVYNPHTELPHDLLTSGPLWKVAAALHDTFRSITRDTIQSTLSWLAGQEDRTRVTQRFQYRPGSFIITQWTKFRVYTGLELDLDRHGKGVAPALVASPLISDRLLDGLAITLSTEEDLQQGAASSGSGSGATDVVLILPLPVWDILSQDEEFCRFQQS